MVRTSKTAVRLRSPPQNSKVVDFDHFFYYIFFMSSHCDICAFNCYGQKGNYASCCSVEERNWIMGPILDYEKVLKDLSLKYGREVTFKEVFYDFDEVQELSQQEKFGKTQTITRQ